MISACLSLVLSMIGYTFAEPIMAFSGAQADSMEYAVEYFRIIMIGFMPMCVGLTVNAAQRGVGNTRIAMTTNLTSNFINLIFNYLLIQGNLGFPRLEVKGAAIATILGSTVACLLSIRSLLPHDTYLHLNLRTGWKPDKESLRSIWGISYSALIEQVFMRIGFFTYVKIVANLGTMAFATHQICMNIINLSFAFGDGFSIAIASLVGQSMGAKRPDMAKLYVKVNKVLLYGISGALAIFFVVFRYQLVGLFTNEPQIIRQAGQLMLIIAATRRFPTPAVCAEQGMQNILQLPPLSALPSSVRSAHGYCVIRSDWDWSAHGSRCSSTSVCAACSTECVSAPGNGRASRFKWNHVKRVR